MERKNTSEEVLFLREVIRLPDHFPVQKGKYYALKNVQTYQDRRPNRGLNSRSTREAQFAHIWRVGAAAGVLFVSMASGSHPLSF